MSLASLVEARIQKALGSVARARGISEALPAVRVERPKKPEHGDFATNVALASAKVLGQKPQEIAAALRGALEGDATFARIEVAGPGFLNLKLAPRAFHGLLADVLAEGRAYGRARAATGERINLEFVSANPTGPLHVGHGRSAVVGDIVGRLLDAAGHRVVREYYVNDAGNQVKLLADSVLAKVNRTPDPEGGYGANAYIDDLAEWAKKHCAELLAKNDVDALGKRLASVMLSGYAPKTGIQPTLRYLGIMHDVWSSEAALHGDGRVERAIETLRENQWLEEKDNATFFLSSKLGDDKDRVVYKTDGGHTYLASDIAYHKDKLDRGFDRLIDVWGADHHGYIPRVSAAITALGQEKSKLEVILVQMVAIVKNGEPYKMGKRLGNFVTIDEVVEEIDEATGRVGSGRDALRYFFASRRPDAHMEIDVEIAKKQSLDNPVYYLQYGHARLSSILRKAEEECGIALAALPTEIEELAALVHPDELAIVQLLGEWPAAMREAATAREPHKIVGYLTNLAQAFQSYYTRLKNENDTILPRDAERKDGSWKSDPARVAKVYARLAWVRAIRDVYAAGLHLLGITALDRMERALQTEETD
ncbi:MAG: arginine--tRNA ligase [Polyangiales bacterium]